MNEQLNILKKLEEINQNIYWQGWLFFLMLLAMIILLGLIAFKLW